MIVSRPGKAALTLSNFNKYLGQLEVDCIDNVSIKEVYLGKNGLHLNPLMPGGNKKVTHT